MNLGEFRQLTAMLPDDYEIVTSPGDATWWEVSRYTYDHPVAGAPGLVILADGQEVTEEYLIPIRLDLDEEVTMPGRDVPPDWEIKDQGTGEWMQAAKVMRDWKPEPDDMVDARPGAAFWEGKR
jgi:hypothetical protein